MSMLTEKKKTHHFVRRPTPQGSRSFECRAEACGFHCRSGRAFAVDEAEKSSEKQWKENH